ncbi:MAG: hypothetical protein U0872_11065 [Planctomycetaceae bacterium]
MDEWGKNDSALRFMFWAFVIGLLLAYTLVFPLKWVGLMPDHLTWLGLALGPGALFSIFISAFAGLLWLKQRWWMLFLPVSLISLAVLTGLNVANWNR